MLITTSLYSIRNGSIEQDKAEIEANWHAVSGGQVSMNELQTGQVGHAFRDLNSELNQVSYGRTLHTNNSL